MNLNYIYSTSIQFKAYKTLTVKNIYDICNDINCTERMRYIERETRGRERSRERDGLPFCVALKGSARWSPNNFAMFVFIG